ncbi:predicted Hydrolase or acyltransferase (alpha/beta hydrolase superfamily) [Hahella chejuensis KCTC 2396]|uniref:Predicted Hydrolase or acyltransferase (Alpha/beta hydrolase superfamily) n=1 Tax=Hahella chejuensis (strain KCTC 2396) TaxID=349521 RepID=Q2SBD6_HAHCH|nr:alpha/beta fold hydrolase [Hahella chejuensis]ABC32038.1 predicted Hydrolase or acyltransferase (alpha/beta hydrolase superfamily) [Hahella chejuensis KCTC 2396]
MPDGRIDSVHLIGGWAQPQAALEPLAQALGGISVVTTWTLSDSYAALTRRLSAQWNERTLIVGWSLGGSLAIRRLAAENLKVARLALVACNPFFAGDSGWPGVGLELLDGFADDLNSDRVRLLRRFNLLQTQGAAAARAQARQTLNFASAIESWSEQQLSASLEWLRSWDLRDELAYLDVPVTHFLGEADAIAPVALAQCLQQNYPCHQVEIVGGMSHFPDAEASRFIAESLQSG